VHTLGRQARVPVEIGGHRLPAGTIVIVSPLVIHRRADCFTEPDRFDPGRFAPGRAAAVGRFTWLPFGAGPRACLGGQLATLEAQMVLARFAQTVRLWRVPERVTSPEMLVTLRPRGLRLRVQRRSPAPPSSVPLGRTTTR
jgi:cytochrome P450